MNAAANAKQKIQYESRKTQYNNFSYNNNTSPKLLNFSYNNNNRCYYYIKIETIVKIKSDITARNQPDDGYPERKCKNLTNKVQVCWKIPNQSANTKLKKA